ncbi:hypothetical protein [Pseudofulvibacter geojedonensis]|uniref:Glycerophosphoryl diester phosphodiesterase membrane domain-containing protein n=1 Tax=Pseudofulvibacter geojedonensis TaxID=1123758 RepID=A0ABW3HZM5_9FLAO
MQLYKIREFGDLFSDTFKFLGKYGKHYFVNYLIINGVLTLLMILSMTPLLSVFFELPSFDAKAGGDFKFLLEENIQLLTASFAFIFIIAVLISAVTYAFTPIYFKLLEQKGGINFTTSELIDALKQHYFKSLKGMIGLFFLSILLSIPLLIAVLLTACTIIGWLIPVAMFMMLITFTMYEYLTKKENRFFSSFGYAWDLITQKSKFWHASGCVALVILIMGIVQQVISGGLQLGFGLQAQPEVNGADINFGAEYWTAMVILSLAGILIQLITNIVTYLNMGITFYSLKAEKENISSENTIDEIGRDI